MNATTDNAKIHSQSRLAHLSDEELLAGYRHSGEASLFAELVQRYEREVYSYLKRYLGDAEMAEDAFQAAFLQVHLKCELFESGRKFRPWLYTIATNQAIDARRRNKRHRMASLDRAGKGGDGEDVGKLVDLLVSDDVNPLDRVDAQENRRLIERTLEALPENMRAVIHLVYYQGLKYREAAEVLDVPVGTIKSRLHGAILKLTEVWKTEVWKTEARQDTQKKPK